jgi:hypothetical protein
MRQSLDNVLRVRVPISVSERLRLTATHYARSPSDVVREAVVLQLDRLSGQRLLIVEGNYPPEAA